MRQRRGGSGCQQHKKSSQSKARAGHHLPPQLLSSGCNVFAELGNEFTLLAFDAQDATVAAFAQAAKALRLPLKIVRDSYDQGRRAYEAKLILVRPDRYIAWVGDVPPAAATSLLAKSLARDRKGQRDKQPMRPRE